MSSERIRRILPAILFVGPPILVAALVRRWALDVPFNDEWSAVPLVVKMHDHALGFGDLWAQHNEHRPVIQRLVLLALARLSDWDIRWELATNILAGLATLAVLVLLMRRTLEGSKVRWLAVAASVLVFSLVQYENWMWGWMLSAFLVMLVVSIGVLALTFPKRGVIGMAIAGTLAPLCFGSGLILPFVLAGATLVHPLHGTVKERRIKAAILAGLGVLVAIVYTAGLKRPSAGLALSKPIAYLLYSFTYLGAPLAREWSSAAIAGFVGLLAFVSAGVWLHRRSPEYRNVLVPWGALGAYAIASGMLTGLARVGHGVDQALASRYTTTTTAFWLSTVVLVVLVVADHLRESERSRLVGVTAFAAALGAFAASSFVRASMDDADRYSAWSRTLIGGRECVVGYREAPDDCLHMFMPSLNEGDPKYVRAWSADLERLSLGPFRAGAKLPSVSGHLDPALSAGYLDRIAYNPDAKIVIVSGWAIDPVKHARADSVLVNVDGEPFGTAVTDLERPDVASATGVESAGWHLVIRTFRLAPGPHAFAAYALFDGDRAATLSGGQSFEVPPP